MQSQATRWAIPTRLFWIMALMATAVYATTAALAAPTGDTLDTRGIVTSFPAGLVGEWIVAGESYTASASTVFKQEDATFAVDGCVDVEYTESGGTRQAVRIDAKQLYDCQGGGGTQPWQQYGRITSFPAGLIGSWVVGTTSYTTTVSTSFQQEHGAFAVGRCVEVKFQPGTFSATEIETEDDYHCANPGQPALAQHYGVVDSFPAGLVGSWSVGGQPYTATTSTQFQQNDGPFVVGGCVEVKYTPADSTAVEIETKEPARCDGAGGGTPAISKQYGLLVSRPVTVTGMWTIGALTVEATAATQLEQEHGLLDVGVCASASHSGGLATKIESEEPYKCEGGSATNFAYGLIENLPANLFGTWLVSGVPYQVNPSTELNQEDGPFAVAACVKVTYFTENGVNQATEVETQSGDDCAPGPQTPAPVSKIYATIDSLPASPFIGPWSIGGFPFTAVASTLFDQEDGAFGAGQCVEAKFTAATGELWQVESKPADRCVILKLYGVVESIPVGNMGTWIIGGREVVANAQTVFSQEHGVLAVGAFVEVRYALDGATAVASRIETHVAPGAGRTTSVGTLQSISVDGQTWMISGQPYQADPAADVRGGARAPQVGQPVYYNSYTSNTTAFFTTAALGSQNFLPVITR